MCGRSTVFVRLYTGQVPDIYRTNTGQQLDINEGFYLVRTKEGRRKSEGRALEKDGKNIGGGWKEEGRYI
jgi:hypothetical protein